jgi:hypothetical protein
MSIPLPQEPPPSVSPYSPPPGPPPYTCGGYKDIIFIKKNLEIQNKNCTFPRIFWINLGYTFPIIFTLSIKTELYNSCTLLNFKIDCGIKKFFIIFSF